MNGSEQGIFLDKKVHVSRIIDRKMYHYNGVCLALSDISITILDKKTNRSMSFPRNADTTIEVTE